MDSRAARIADTSLSTMPVGSSTIGSRAAAFARTTDPGPKPFPDRLGPPDAAPAPLLYPRVDITSILRHDLSLKGARSRSGFSSRNRPVRAPAVRDVGYRSQGAP